MSVEIKEVAFENYGKCIQLSNGLIEAVVTVECGPRIVRFGFTGERNLFYNDLSRQYVTRSAALQEYYGANAAFYCYGGHRLWMAPKRIPQTYYPDNGPVVYGIHPDSVTFAPAGQKKNQIETGFEILMSEGTADIMVVHTAKNCSKERQRLALWAVTMLTGGGLEIVPQSQDAQNELYPNRFLSLWPCSSPRDPRFYFGERYLTLQHRAELEKPFKLGINNVQGWAAYVCNDFTFMKRYVHTPHTAYPDNGCSFETYLNGDYVELESLSPLYTVEPGEAIRHVENLSLFRTPQVPAPENETEIEQLMNQLL